ncbi:MAG: ABC transporter ATP-binding protein [Micrococcaceae bacterium]
MMQEVAIAVDGLTVAKGKKTILHNVSFRHEKGKILGLLGPSGCGKTTVMRSILGLQKTKSGKITVLGLDVDNPQLRSMIGYVSQEASVYTDLTVEDNIKYFAELYGSPKSEIDKSLDYVGLKSQRKQLVGSLSGGQRNRVSLASALVGNPELLIMDEPTVGLDPLLRVQLWQLFDSLKQSGVTLLVSSHVMDEANRCDDLLLMREGYILRHESPDVILKETNTTSVEDAFLAIIEQGEEN